jgi:hypothetical protein
MRCGFSLTKSHKSGRSTVYTYYRNALDRRIQLLRVDGGMRHKTGSLNTVLCGMGHLAGNA